MALWHLEEGRNGNDGPALSMVDTAMPNILDMKLRSRTIAHDGYVLSVRVLSLPSLSFSLFVSLLLRLSGTLSLVFL